MPDLIVRGGTLIDGVGGEPVQGLSIAIEAGRIKSIDRDEVQSAPPGAAIIDASGKYVIPGLMDGNVHLLLDVRMENLVRHENSLENLILEAAQVALCNGLTSVFDTWGPRRPLVAVRDRIKSGALIGSRIFCAGNIIGLDGPFSQDFLPNVSEVASAQLVEEINTLWSENMGSDLTWMTPENIAVAVRGYCETGIDFIKYAASEHRLSERSAFLAFSPLAQEQIVREAHRAGLTAQAHSSSVEALRVAVEAGVDVIQHCNMTGPVPIPESTLRILAQKKVFLTVFPFTKKRRDQLMQTGDSFSQRMFGAADVNISHLIHSGASLLLATDAGLLSAEAATDPVFGRSWVALGEDNLAQLGEGHFHWMKAMEEKGFASMDILKAATSNIAEAYGKSAELGTVARGKIADLLVLDKNPLEAAENYRSIHAVIKGGVVVDRAVLPLTPILTRVRTAAPARGPSGMRSGSGSPLCC